MEASLFKEFVVFLTHCSGKFHQSQRSDVASGLDAEAFTQGEQECERTEVIALREIGAESTRHVPEVARTMRKRLFIGEEIRVAFHRDPESLGKDVVPRRWRFLGSFDVKLVCFIRYGLAE